MHCLDPGPAVPAGSLVALLDFGAGEPSALRFYLDILRRKAHSYHFVEYPSFPKCLNCVVFLHIQAIKDREDTEEVRLRSQEDLRLRDDDGPLDLELSK